MVSHPMFWIVSCTAFSVTLILPFYLFASPVDCGGYDQV